MTDDTYNLKITDSGSSVGKILNLSKNDKMGRSSSSSCSSSSNINNDSNDNDNNNNNDLMISQAGVSRGEKSEEELYMEILGQLRYDEIPLLSGYHYR